MIPHGVFKIGVFKLGHGELNGGLKAQLNAFTARAKPDVKPFTKIQVIQQRLGASLQQEHKGLFAIARGQGLFQIGKIGSQRRDGKPNTFACDGQNRKPQRLKRFAQFKQALPEAGARLRFKAPRPQQFYHLFPSQCLVWFQQQNREQGSCASIGNRKGNIVQPDQLKFTK